MQFRLPLFKVIIQQMFLFLKINRKRNFIVAIDVGNFPGFQFLKTVMPGNLKAFPVFFFTLKY